MILFYVFWPNLTLSYRRHILCGYVLQLYHQFNFISFIVQTYVSEVKKREWRGLAAIWKEKIDLSTDKLVKHKICTTASNIYCTLANVKYFPDESNTEPRRSTACVCRLSERRQPERYIVNWRETKTIVHRFHFIFMPGYEPKNVLSKECDDVFIFFMMLSYRSSVWTNIQQK